MQEWMRIVQNWDAKTMMCAERKIKRNEDRIE